MYSTRLLATTVSVLVGAASFGAHGAEYTITAGHGVQQSHPTHVAMERLAEMVDERSDGRLEITIAPDRQLGEERAMVEGLQLGTVDMTVVSTGPLGGFVPEINVLDLPFLFRDSEHAYTVFDGPIGDQLLEKFDAEGIKAVSIWENGWRHLTTSKEVEGPDDLDGVKIRTMENEVHIAAFEALGASPVPMVWGEVYTSLDQGVIDAQENPITVIYTNSLYEVQSHTTLTGHVYGPHVAMFSPMALDRLPDDLREMLIESTREVADYQRQVSQELEEEQAEKLREEGMEVQSVDTEPFREIAQTVYSDYEERFGAELIERIQTTQP